MNVVFAVEKVVRTLFAPDKINLASFGNMTPHLHWHVIPRWHDDRHFPSRSGAASSATPSGNVPSSDDTLRLALRKQLHPEQYQG